MSAVNDFAAEALIIARLKSQVTSAALVCSLRSVAGAANLGSHLPALIVEPGKSKAEQQFAQGRGVKVRESWIVAVSVPDTPDAVNFSADFSGTGELLASVRLALQGWRPAAPFELMEYEGVEAPTGRPGEIVFALEFSVVHALEVA